MQQVKAPGEQRGGMFRGELARLREDEVPIERHSHQSFRVDVILEVHADRTVFQFTDQPSTRKQCERVGHFEFVQRREGYVSST